MPLTIKPSSGSGSSTLISVAGTTTNDTLTLPAVTGNIITSADTGTVTQTMLSTNVAGNGPSFSANTSGQSFTNNTTTKISYSGEVWDLGGCYNNTSGTVTLNGLSVPSYSFMPNVAGYYVVFFGIVCSQNTTAGAEIIIQMRRNGTAFTWGNNQYASATHFNELSGSSMIYCDGSTHYIDIVFFNASGGTSSVTSDANTYFQAFLARSA